MSVHACVHVHMHIVNVKGHVLNKFLFGQIMDISRQKLADLKI